jgi:hypothetical protein
MGGEAGEADGVERTIIVSPMRVKSSSLREHHICLLLKGEISMYVGFARKDGQFRPLRMPGAGFIGVGASGVKLCGI